MKSNLAGSNPSIERHSSALQDGTPSQWYSPGEENPRAVLTEEQVLSIYASDAPVKDLARQYGVNRNTISMIRHGRRWTWLTQGHDAQGGAA